MQNNQVNWFNILLCMLLISSVYAGPPSNDDLEGAIAITLPYHNIQSTVDAGTTELEEFPFCTFSEASVWYQYTPPSDEEVIFSTLGSDYDTVLGVWTGEQHPLFEVTCNDNNNDTIIQAQLNASLTEGIPYFISVAGFNNEMGTLVFDAKTIEPLANDDLANAIDINVLPYSRTQSITRAINSPQEEISSCITRGSKASIWFQYTPSSDTFLVLDTHGSTHDTVLSVWHGSKHPLTELNCNNDVDDEEVQSQLRMTFEANKTYYINVSSLNAKQVENDIIVFNASQLATLGMGINAKGDFFDTIAYFMSQIKTTSGLYGNNLNIAKSDEVTISAIVTVATPHIGKTADILMVAMVSVDSPTFFMRNGDTWEAWDSAIPSLMAAEEKILLSNRLEKEVYQGSLADLPFISYVVYVGYRLENGDVIFNGTEPIRFWMQ